MPIYEYRCRNGHQFEVFQAMTDEPVSTCQECGAPVERVFRPVAVHFKGAGFYTTDYARKPAATASSDGTPESKSTDAGSTGEKAAGSGGEKAAGSGGEKAAAGSTGEKAASSSKSDD
jgi:putative FmdB family regulatory protein